MSTQPTDPAEGLMPPQPPPSPKQRHVGRGIVIGIAAVIFALAIVVGVSFLVTGKNPAAAVRPKSPTCRQQYETWERKTAPELKKLSAALKSSGASRAGQHEIVKQAKSAMERASRIASVLRRSYAIPRCADPAGYYDRSMAITIQVANAVQSASGPGELMRATLPLQDMMASEDMLAHELDRTLSVK